MKAVILAGGRGTRLAEETATRPKPMVRIGGKPILWHIMKIYARHGIEDFVVCCGYKGYMIKEYFANYRLHNSDASFDLGANRIDLEDGDGGERWRVTLVDTGDKTATGGRLKRVAPYLGDDTFCLTYGDGVADVDVAALVAFHRREAKLATMTAIRPPSKYGVLAFHDEEIVGFEEKPTGDDLGGGWINGGFFVLEPAVLAEIDGDETPWEHAPLQRLVARGEVAAYRHGGFWQSMDTLRDKHLLESLWESGAPPWKVW